jgi:urease accessory protein
MVWSARLELAYRREGERCVVHDRHSGPLRVLASLYPEGGAVCHNVLVHPPGGIVGGDRLQLDLTLGAGANALLTTPGATRFYRSAGEVAWQSVHARVANGARLEWLPQETILHRGASVDNSLSFELDAGAEMIGWDMLALGLPASGEVFDRGRIAQRIALPGVWLEQGVIDGEDARLLQSPLGLAGHHVLGIVWFAAGEALTPQRRSALLDAARDTSALHTPRATVGATSPQDRVVLLRVLAPQVEPVMQLLASVWARWRALAWGIEACVPRVWRT